MGGSRARMTKRIVYHTIHMCRFCTKDYPQCGAEPVLSGKLTLSRGKLDSKTSVVACDQYENPVEVLKKKFH